MFCTHCVCNLCLPLRPWRHSHIFVKNPSCFFSFHTHSYDSLNRLFIWCKIRVSFFFTNHRHSMTNTIFWKSHLYSSTCRVINVRKQQTICMCASLLLNSVFLHLSISLCLSQFCTALIIVSFWILISPMVSISFSGFLSVQTCFGYWLSFLSLLEINSCIPHNILKHRRNILLQV
jgi:hypothetical protein